MALDPYSFCPCGSGKKLKWCCQHLFEDFNRAYQQFEEGQRDTAIRLVTELTAKHPDNPEPWGQLASLQCAVGEIEQGEKSLERAFALNPNYPYGLFLRARLRQHEGEPNGALILARRAAEAYHPEAFDHLSNVFSLIYELEMKRMRPIAGHAALRILLRCNPADENLRKEAEGVFGAQSSLPACAREQYAFLSPSESASAERRAAWNAVLKRIEHASLGTIAEAFEKLTAEDGSDASAWWNLAVAQAWLGENRKALDAVERYIPLESDDGRAEKAAAMTEVLRMTPGFEQESDYLSYSVVCRIRSAEALDKLFNEWADAQRIMLHESEEHRGVLSGMIMAADAPGILTSEGPAVADRQLAAYIVIAGENVRVWGPSKDRLDSILDEFRTKAPLSMEESTIVVGPGGYPDVVTEALVFPVGTQDQAAARRRIIEEAGRYFEEVWIHKPLRSLSGNIPLDAAGHPVLRKKLRGVVRFMQDCAAVGILSGYDFNRLRHKLGLDGAAPVERASIGGPALDFRSMNTAELLSLAPEGLTDAQLDQAFQAAQRLGADDTAVRFVQALTARTPSVEVDRWVYFSYLAQRAAGAGDLDALLDHVNEGQKQDCEHNGGRRRNDYELRRAQAHVKRREPDQAHEVFTRLIERAPDNLQYRGSAAEGMLSLRQSAQALAFAESGLEAARRLGNRDSEQYLMELVEAAKRQG